MAVWMGLAVASRTLIISTSLSLFWTWPPGEGVRLLGAQGVGVGDGQAQSAIEMSGYQAFVPCHNSCIVAKTNPESHSVKGDGHHRAYIVILHTVCSQWHNLFFVFPLSITLLSMRTDHLLPILTLNTRISQLRCSFYPDRLFYVLSLPTDEG